MSDDFNEPQVEDLTIEDFYNDEINHEQLKKDQLDLALPAGTYTTVPELNARYQKNKQGRRIASFFGDAVMGDKKGKISFRVSSERANKRTKNDDGTFTDTGKPDNAYKLYLQAVKAYKVAYGEEATSPVQVFKYLSEFPIRVRVTVFEDSGENFVVSISPVREQ